MTATPCPVCGAMNDQHDTYLHAAVDRIAALEAKYGAIMDKLSDEDAEVGMLVAGLEAKMGDKGEAVQVYAGCGATAVVWRPLDGADKEIRSGGWRCGARASGGWVALCTACRDAAKRPTPPTFEQLVERVGPLPTGQLATATAKRPTTDAVADAWRRGQEYMRMRCASIAQSELVLDDEEAEDDTLIIALSTCDIAPYVAIDEPVPAQAQPSGNLPVHVMLDAQEPSRLTPERLIASRPVHQEPAQPSGGAAEQFSTQNKCLVCFVHGGGHDQDTHCRLSGGAAGGDLSGLSRRLVSTTKELVASHERVAALEAKLREAERERDEAKACHASDVAFMNQEFARLRGELDEAVKAERVRCLAWASELGCSCCDYTGEDALEAIETGKEPPK